jgi:hypothetical protein
MDRQAMVYEEVNVGKIAVRVTQRASGTVRKEIVDATPRVTSSSLATPTKVGNHARRHRPEEATNGC